MNIEKKGEGKVRVVIMMVMMMVMMMGCNSGGVGGVGGKVDLAKKNSFLESLVKIGEGFQEIFVGFGSAFGDVLGFSVVKSGDKRSEVGKHFEKVKKGLEDTNNKLKELSGDILGTKNADGSTIAIVKSVIKGANDVFEQLIGAVTKLSGVTNANVDIGDASSAGGAVGANRDSVNTVIEGVKAIIGVAEKLDIKIEKGTSGGEVANANGLKLLAHNAQVDQGAAPKLAEEVSKADAWAVIDKIKNATTVGTATIANAEAGALALGGGNTQNDNGTAKTNADLAAAVALKAMTKDGKFTQPQANEVGAVKAAAVSAVNKVLEILDIIIKKTVSSNLDKVKEAVKGIKYSESSVTETSQSDTSQTTNKQ
ncbi:variable large family protein [Borrelia duttonii]|uniref:Variable large protein n=1 Tax=Borrelia duttonii (strain Ly) TaxID=412419 RepID=B5RNM8_BORDL|nr:vlp protein [Borrelia duttonii Ly]